VPFDKEDTSGIVYVWVGDLADSEEARITEEIAREMYDGVRIFCFIYLQYFFVSTRMHSYKLVFKVIQNRQIHKF